MLAGSPGRVGAAMATHLGRSSITFYGEGLKGGKKVEIVVK
jgi:hypothetical protein